MGQGMHLLRQGYAQPDLGVCERGLGPGRILQDYDDVVSVAGSL